MQDLSKYSMAQLQALEIQVNEELKTRHFLSVSQAREQILHIARNAGISLGQVAAIKSPKAPKASAVAMKIGTRETPLNSGAVAGASLPGLRSGSKRASR
jgi:DNA-binding protein H-NS